MSTAAKAEKKRLISLNTRNTLVGLSFILPNFIGFTVFILVPVIFSFVLSVMKWDGFTAMEFVGLQNFVNIFKDRVFRAALRQTIVFSVFTVIFSMIAALGLALLLNTKIKFVNFFRSAIFFPYVASIVAVGAVFKAMFLKGGGPINQFLSMIGVPAELLPGWLSSTKWALMAVIIVQVWKNMGYFMLIYLAALQDIPSSLYEAASIDGASKWRQFRSITFPMLTPSHFFVFIMLTINSFKTFDLIFALTEGGPGTATTLLSMYIYNQSFISWNYGNASAAAIILLLIVGSITLFLCYIATIAIPWQIYMLPQYSMMQKLHLVDTHLGYILMQSFAAFGVFLLRQFYQSVPNELIEAARIDGLSEYGCYFRIVLPLAKPAIATLTIFTFVNAWNDFMGPMIYFNSEANKTIPLGIRMFIGQYSSEYQLIMAASVVALLPILILYVFCQRFFVQGIATSGLKG